MLVFPGVRGVKGSVRRVRVLVSRRDTAVQKLRLRLRPVRLRLFRLYPVRADAGLRHDNHTGFCEVLNGLHHDFSGCFKCINILRWGINIVFAHLGIGHRVVSFGGALEDFGINVGAVLNEGHLQISSEHLAPQQIPIDVAAGVAQVAKVIDREPAAVDARLVGGQRGKRLRTTSEGFDAR